MAQQDLELADVLHLSPAKVARTFELRAVRYMGFPYVGEDDLDGELAEGVPCFNGHFVTLYKTERAAFRNCGMRAHMTKEQLETEPRPLIVIFDPDNLEPVSISLREKADWLYAQIVKWRDKLFASGLSDDEAERICEALILDCEVLLRKYRARQAL